MAEWTKMMDYATNAAENFTYWRIRHDGIRFLMQEKIIIIYYTSIMPN